MIKPSNSAGCSKPNLTSLAIVRVAISCCITGLLAKVFGSKSNRYRLTCACRTIYGKCGAESQFGQGSQQKIQGRWLAVASPAAAGAFEISGRGSGEGLFERRQVCTLQIWCGCHGWERVLEPRLLFWAYVLIAWGFCLGFRETRNAVRIFGATIQKLLWLCAL